MGKSIKMGNDEFICIAGNNIKEMIKVRLNWENLFGNGLEIMQTVKK